MCDYQGYEFGASYPDSYCIEGKLYDADSDFQHDEDVPCPLCRPQDAIQWHYHRHKDMCEVGDTRSWKAINKEHFSNAVSLVADIRKNRGVDDEIDAVEQAEIIGGGE